MQRCRAGIFFRFDSVKQDWTSWKCPVPPPPPPSCEFVIYSSYNDTAHCWIQLGPSLSGHSQQRPVVRPPSLVRPCIFSPTTINVFTSPVTKGHLFNMATGSYQIGWLYQRRTTVLCPPKVSRTVLWSANWQAAPKIQSSPSYHRPGGQESQGNELDICDLDLGFTGPITRAAVHMSCARFHHVYWTDVLYSCSPSCYVKGTAAGCQCWCYCSDIEQQNDKKRENARKRSGVFQKKMSPKAICVPSVSTSCLVTARLGWNGLGEGGRGT